MAQLILLAFCGMFGGFASDGCCFYSIVDRVPYILVEENADTNGYECNPNCLYRRFDDPESRFCPSNGEMKVVDLDFFFLCKDDFKDLLDGVEKNMDTLEYGRCDGTTGSCTGGECSGLFDPNIQCARPVLDLNDRAHCSGPEDATIITITINNAFCKTKAPCPRTHTDKNCNCCKYGHYGSGKCRKQCKCKGTCSYFATREYCPNSYSRLQPCCECNRYKNICTGKGCSSEDYMDMDTGDGGGGADGITTTSTTTTTTATTMPIIGTPICTEICNFIVEQTTYTTDGTNYPWNSCSMDYAFCCECEGVNNYGTKCPEFCKCNTTPDQLRKKLTTIGPTTATATITTTATATITLCP